jgi:outer membrane immunogenic protein
MIRKIALALCAVSAAGSAYAADFIVKAPVPAPVSWTGFYIGVNGGGASGTSDWTFPRTGALSNHNTSGGLVGGTLGFNWQFPATHWVLGAEADWDWASISGDTNCPNPRYLCQSKLGDLGTARARLGYAAYDHFLFYGTGGLAWGSDQIQTTWLPTGVSAGSTGVRTGWTAGAGVEYAFWGPLTGLSAKVEYLHYDLGGATTTVSTGSTVVSQESGNVVRAGVNWKLPLR